MPMISRMSGWAGPTGRKFTNPLSLGSGGSTQTYSKSSQLWISHTFTSPGTFTITSATQPFTVMCLGGGQGGGYDHPADRRYAGSAGTAIVSSVTASEGVVNITIGSGGGGGAGTHQSGGPGSASGFGSYLNSSSGTGTVTTDVQNGTNVTYANGTYGYGGAAGYLTTGQTGGPGLVIIAYRVA